MTNTKELKLHSLENALDRGICIALKQKKVENVEGIFTDLRVVSALPRRIAKEFQKPLRTRHFSLIQWKQAEQNLPKT